jgi:hypothetical protein
MNDYWGTELDYSRHEELPCTPALHTQRFADSNSIHYTSLTNTVTCDSGGSDNERYWGWPVGVFVDFLLVRGEEQKCQRIDPLYFGV